MLNGGLPVAQIIAIGQSYMAKNTGLALQPRGIDALTQKILNQTQEHRTASAPAEIQFLQIIALLSSVGKQSWFSVGTPLQRQLWCGYWEGVLTQLELHYAHYKKNQVTITFRDWLSRQPISEQVWSLFSMGVSVIERQMTSAQPTAPINSLKAQADVSVKPAPSAPHFEPRSPRVFIIELPDSTPAILLRNLLIQAARNVS